VFGVGLLVFGGLAKGSGPRPNPSAEVRAKLHRQIGVGAVSPSTDRMSWHTNCFSGSPVGATDTPNVVRFFNRGYKVLGSKAQLYLSTGAASSFFDVGVYSISGSTLTLQWSTGSQSTGTSTSPVLVSVTGLTSYTLLPNTNYYLAYCSHSATAVLYAIHPSVGSTANGEGSTLGGTGATANTFGINSTNVCTSSGNELLPSTMPVGNVINQAINVQAPWVVIQN
jgi:hypothetical protein